MLLYDDSSRQLKKIPVNAFTEIEMQYCVIVTSTVKPRNRRDVNSKRLSFSNHADSHDKCYVLLTFNSFTTLIVRLHNVEEM